jgi:hypothetical protein
VEFRIATEETNKFQEEERNGRWTEKRKKRPAGSWACSGAPVSGSPRAGCSRLCERRKRKQRWSAVSKEDQKPVRKTLESTPGMQRWRPAAAPGACRGPDRGWKLWGEQEWNQTRTKRKKKWSHDGRAPCCGWANVEKDEKT